VATILESLSADIQKNVALTTLNSMIMLLTFMKIEPITSKVY